MWNDGLSSTTMSWGFNPTSGQVSFSGNVLATSHIVSREPNLSLMSLKGLVPKFLHFRVKDKLSSLSILDSTFDRKFPPLRRYVIMSYKLLSCHTKLYITLTFIFKRII